MDNRPALRWEIPEGNWTPHELAVVGGSDVTGEVTFVGRGYFEGDIIPGKIVPSHGVCYVSWGGREHALREYQILTTLDDAKVIWLPACNGEVPSGAVQGGTSASGEPLFVGRTQYQDAHVVGKVHPSHQLLYYPFGGEEKATAEYEVLCIKKITF